MDTFDDAAYTRALAGYLQIAASQIELRFTAGSLIVDATISIPAGTSVAGSSAAIASPTGASPGATDPSDVLAAIEAKLASLDGATASELLRVPVLSVAPLTRTSDIAAVNAATESALEAEATQRDTLLYAGVAGGSALLVVVGVVVLLSIRRARVRRAQKSFVGHPGWSEAALAGAASSSPSSSTTLGSSRPPVAVQLGPKGHDTKGHDTKGHDTKGHDTKGHDTKGHDTKGHDTKGHDTKGAAPLLSSPAEPRKLTSSLSHASVCSAPHAIKSNASHRDELGVASVEMPPSTRRFTPRSGGVGGNNNHAHPPPLGPARGCPRSLFTAREAKKRAAGGVAAGDVDPDATAADDQEDATSGPTVFLPLAHAPPSWAAGPSGPRTSAASVSSAGSRPGALGRSPNGRSDAPPSLRRTSSGKSVGSDGPPSLKRSSSGKSVGSRESEVETTFYL